MAETKVPSSLLAEAVVKSVFSKAYTRNDPALPASRIRIYSGGVFGSDDGTDVIEVASDITVDIAASGANGLDAGSVASSTWYYIYVIHNPATETTAGLFSTSSSSPTMPSGYTIKRLIGAVRTDGSSNLQNYFQRGDTVYYQTWSPELYNSSFSSTSWSPMTVTTSHMPVAIARSALFSIYAYKADEADLFYAPGSPSGSSGGMLMARLDDDQAERNTHTPWLMIGEDDCVSFRRARSSFNKLVITINGFKLFV